MKITLDSKVNLRQLSKGEEAGESHRQYKLENESVEKNQLR